MLSIHSTYFLLDKKQRSKKFKLYKITNKDISYVIKCIIKGSLPALLQQFPGFNSKCHGHIRYPLIDFNQFTYKGFYYSVSVNTNKNQEKLYKLAHQHNTTQYLKSSRPSATLNFQAQLVTWNTNNQNTFYFISFTQSHVHEFIGNL